MNSKRHLLLLGLLLLSHLRPASAAASGVVRLSANLDTKLRVVEGSSLSYSISLSARPSFTTWVAVHIEPVVAGSVERQLLAASPSVLECQPAQWDEKMMCQQVGEKREAREILCEPLRASRQILPLPGRKFNSWRRTTT